jgi:hypothetical protein
VTPFPSFPQIQSADLGEGEQKLFMQIAIPSQVVLTSPPFSKTENGGGRRGSGVVVRGRMGESERQVEGLSEGFGG